MYGQFVREMPETADDKETWSWLRKADLKVQTDAMLYAEQEQAIGANYVKPKIEGAQKEYKRRHDNVAHQKLCRKCNRKGSKNWYQHAPEGIIENEELKILWDVTDIGVVNKNERSCGITDSAKSGDIRVGEKEKEKIERYQELKREIKRIWNIRSIKIIPVVVGAFDSTSKKLKNCIEELGDVIRTALLQKIALPGTSRILNNVLDCR